MNYVPTSKETKLVDDLLKEVGDIKHGRQECNEQGLVGIAEDLASHVRRLQLERDTFERRALAAEASLEALRNDIRALNTTEA
jgi:hypothetical protein